MRNRVSNNISKSTDEESRFVIYPNPVGNEIYVYLEKELRSSYITIESISGTTILKQAVENKEIIGFNVGSLRTGLYYIKLKKNEEPMLYTGYF